MNRQSGFSQLDWLVVVLKIQQRQTTMGKIGILKQEDAVKRADGQQNDYYSNGIEAHCISIV